MAKIEFTGFVQEWNKTSPQHPAWGMKVAEPHSKKEGEKYVTVSRTFRTVKSAYDVDIDFSQFKEGDRVNIQGTELTEVREYNGEKMYNLIVKADTVTLAEKPNYPSRNDNVELLEDDAPF